MLIKQQDREAYSGMVFVATYFIAVFILFVAVTLIYLLH
jgi:hypothetical protein